MPAESQASRVAVVGLGKMGLPLAAQYARKGMSVVGCDVDEAVVAAINQGDCPISEEPGLADAIAEAVAGGRLRASSDTSAEVRAADVVIVIVPLVVDERGTADFRALDSATEAVGRGLHPGVLVVYETTVPVGTTRQRFGRRLAAISGLEPGRDFHLAFSPERVQSGTVFHDLRSYPKLVGGIDDPSSDAAVRFYEAALDHDSSVAAPRVRRLASAEAAELTKLAETAYRDVNIALANELARFADAWKVDILEAIDAANTQPYSHLHRPGVGVGGHCIPVYPHFLIGDERAGNGLRLPRVAREVNDGMAAYAVEVLGHALDGLAGKTVLVLGFTYRGDVREHFMSSAKALVAEIGAAGGRAVVHDPLYDCDELRSFGVEPYCLERPGPVDAVVLQAYHRAYRDLDIATLPGCRVVVDGRNALDRAHVEARGLTYIGIGRS